MSIHSREHDPGFDIIRIIPYRLFQCDFRVYILIPFQLQGRDNVRRHVPVFGSSRDHVEIFPQALLNPEPFFG
ncbi:hypothetical protein ES703_64727 [subsurface metagenome]